MKKLYVVGSSSEVALSIQKLFKKEWTTTFYGRSNPHGFTNFVEYPGVEDEKSVELLKNSIVYIFEQTKDDGNSNEWGEVSELLYLFYDERKWTKSDVNYFMIQLWNYLEY